MGRFRRPFPFQSLPPLRSAKGSILNLFSVGSTRRAQNLSMYQGVIQLCPGVGAGAGRRRSACQRHRPGSHPQPYTTDERCPWKALGSSKCGTRRSASARSWRPSRRDNPFVSIGILPIYVKQRSFACCIPAFLDKLKNPAYTYNVGRVFWKGRCPFTGSSHLFQEQEVSPDSPSLIKAKLILPAQLLHQVHGKCLATARMFHEP